MEYEKKQPTADCIVARLVPSWGSIVSLLFKTTEPYEHYYDEHGEEVPYGAIASWTDVELPPEENKDEKIKKTAIKILRGVARRVFEYEGVSKESVLAYLENQKEMGIQWLKSDNMKNPDKPYIDKAGMFYTTDGRMCPASEIEKQKETENVSATTMIPFCWTENQKEQKPVEWSEKDKTIIESACYALEVHGHAKLAEMLKSLSERLNLQPKQKHCDYITPHKKFFQWIYNRLIDVHHENPDVDYMRSFKERINNLSFGETTHWKPNEEQIKDLFIAAKEGCDVDSPVAETLKSLYNDLEKL